MSGTEDLKRTPLHPLYASYGAKTIDFGGWEMPVQYSSILAEHAAVRSRAGLFDVSHMGEIDVTGPQALRCLQHLVTNNVARLQIGQALYSPCCYEDGGTVDDVLIYRTGEENYMVVVNASNIEKDLAWMRAHALGAVITDRSQDVVLLALQGPLAESMLQTLTAYPLETIGYYRFAQDVDVAGSSCIVSRTGYTGEDGFELYASAADGPALYEALMSAGMQDGLLPVGLGARDTLRLEARLPLYGHELLEDISPLEAGLSTFVKFDKGPFIGRDALLAQKEQGIPRKLIGFELTDRGIARAGYSVLADGVVIGHVTSGTMGPTVKKSIGLALVEREYGEIGRQIAVDIRGQHVAAMIVKTPFYKRISTSPQV